ncbi:MAG: peptidase S1 [Brevundimonas sp.]|uniref:peptidase S1 n=1 Tax=Brevundimonas sp. TaxID=1871086 RepID=UPI0027330910|nr:peptidase S1 [Brevundimonas sp.]MBX9616133.1 peptidase S1 [Caulobacteraceae bacterium]MDP3403196.1 peptidase S1 [Brevundimonas sp.]
MKSLYLSVGVLAMALAASSASAQQQVNLRAGFLPDPHEVSVYSGGSNNASNLGGRCTGMISDTPDVVVNFNSSGGRLAFQVVSRGDTSLVINGPDGRYYCDDDTNGLNPVLDWSNAPSGQYDVWIGAVGDAASATLQISESSF